MVIVDRECLVCGKGFSVNRSQLDHGRGKCCSLSCAASLSSINRVQKGAANNNWRGGRTATERKRRYRAKSPEKYAAHRALTNAIRNKQITKLPCEKCGEIDVEGHHEDYSKALDVRWLCKKHHLEVHVKKLDQSSRSSALPRQPTL